MFVVTIGFQERVTMLWGAVVHTGLSSGCGEHFCCCSPLRCRTCWVAIAVPFLAHATSVPAQSSGAKVEDMVLEITWPHPSVLRGKLCKALCQPTHMSVATLGCSEYLWIRSTFNTPLPFVSLLSQ